MANVFSLKSPMACSVDTRVSLRKLVRDKQTYETGEKIPCSGREERR